MDNKKSVKLDHTRLYGFKVYGRTTLPQAKIGDMKKTAVRNQPHKRPVQLDPARLFGFRTSDRISLPEAKIGTSKKTFSKSGQSS